MRIEQVYQHVCEGCGERKYNPTPLSEFGGHVSRFTDRYVDSEQDCIQTAKEERERRQRQEAERLAQEETLIKVCAGDEIFRKLVSVFPDEDGRGENWHYLGDRIRALIWEVPGCPDIDTITLGSSIGYHDLLARCIQATKEAAI